MPSILGCCNMDAKIKEIFGGSKGQTEPTTPNSQAADEKINSQQATIKDLDSKLARTRDELTSSKNANEMLLSKLNDQERQIGDLKSEVERHRLSQDTRGLSEDEVVQTYKKEIQQRDERINQLKYELDNTIQLKNKELDALNQKMLLVMDEKDFQIKRLNALGGGVSKKDGNMRQAISAETGKKFDGQIPVIKKTKEESELISHSLLANTFTKTLSQKQRQKIIDAMQRKKVAEGVEIIREGDEGTKMYVLEKGAVSVTKGSGQDRQFICDLGSGQLFGELAILYNCRRTATITTKTEVNTWELERNIFQAIVKSAGMERDEERLALLAQVKELKGLSESKLRKIIDCLEEESYEDGQCIFRQGAVGDLFYIIRTGSVRVTKDRSDGNGEDEIVVIPAGGIFGERALITEDKRSANIYAKGATQCYTLDRTAFTSLVGKIGGFESAEKTQLLEPEEETTVKNELLTQCKFEDMQVICPLGAGGFGLVKLVKVKGIPEKAFALKCIQKIRVVQYSQQRHIMDERNILMEMNSPFILRLYRTFKNSKFVFLLTDVYLGGDLWNVIYGPQNQNRGGFNDAVARFYVACVVEAFGYLHKRHYCYRDLKPENLMIDSNGYVRVVDLGFAKKVLPGHKTWTFCGTPEYIPPEIISNKGHNIAADYWSLGILVFELLSRRTPFRAKDDLAIYEGILRGIHMVQFPSKLSRKAESLIKALCRQDPSERIGYQRNGVNDIRKHRWFQGFDWDGLRNETLQAPMVPQIRDPTDTSNFEKISDEDEQMVPEENSGWDATF